MYRRIGLFALILATAIAVNAGSAKAEGLAPSVAAGGVENALSGKPAPLTVTPAVANPQTAVACNVCFTCGGDWPIFGGVTVGIGKSADRSCMFCLLYLHDPIPG